MIEFIEGKLEDLYIVRDGTHDSPKYLNNSDGFPLVTSKNLKFGELDLTEINYITKEDYDKINQRSKVHKGDLLFAMIGTIGNPVIIKEEPKFAIKNVALLKRNEKGNSIEFLYQVLRSDVILKKLHADAKGGTQKFVSLGYLRNLKIKIPINIGDQHHIASVLSQTEALIAKRKQSLALLDEYVKSSFLQLFGDPVRNEKGWEVNRIEAIVKNENSKRVPIKQSERDKREGNYPYYGATGQIDTINEYKFDGEFLLIAEDGKNLLFRRKNNAFVAKGKFWVNNHAHVLSYTGICNLRYLEHYLNNIDFTPYITGIDQVKLNKDNLDRISVTLPPLALQTQFAHIVEKAEALKAQYKSHLAELEQLYASLSQQFFGLASQSVRAESVQTKSVRTKSVQAASVQAVSVRAVSVQAESVQAESVQAVSVRAESRTGTPKTVSSSSSDDRRSVSRTGKADNASSSGVDNHFSIQGAAPQAKTASTRSDKAVSSSSSDDRRSVSRTGAPQTGSVLSLNIPKNKTGFARQVLAGKIISLFKESKEFTDIKFQKIQYLAEHIAEAELNQNYYQKQAGPYDNRFMHSVFTAQKNNRWFTDRKSGFKPMTKVGEIEKYYSGYFAPKLSQLELLFKKLENASEAHCEVIATVYAVWNNLIIQKQQVSEDKIVEQFFNWSERKATYKKEQVLPTIKWIKDNGFEPKGFGKLIVEPPKKRKVPK